MCTRETVNYYKFIDVNLKKHLQREEYASKDMFITLLFSVYH